MDRITPSSKNPFFLIQGDFDELVPVESCREFLTEYEKVVAKPPLTYLELGGAHHAFDMLFSPRTIYVIFAIEHFLFHNYSSFSQCMK